ncbi:hypothetical protein Cni_G17663 [Canna indica]|uniref:Bifunctional inhibitor/plant lipid transfer protein/seed storage helical domain-containing protein n=1 Tax=Canna indica TaxID=4628 RepID=A0AAQ3QHY9_9LILI|nr:hypothetical protein Cni_G17663 [Canna indica]
MIRALALLVFALVATASPPPSSDPIGCAEELVAASACIPNVAALRDEARDPPAPSAGCCNAVLAALSGAGGGPACLCHLIRQHDLFGFPINATRLSALFLTCWASGRAIADSFTVFCINEVKDLPPLRSNTSTRTAKPDRLNAVSPSPHGEPPRSSNSDLDRANAVSPSPHGESRRSSNSDLDRANAVSPSPHGEPRRSSNSDLAQSPISSFVVPAALLLFSACSCWF